MDGFLSFVKSTVSAVGEELKHHASLLADEGTGITYVGRQLLAMGFPYDDSERVNGATVALPVTAQQAATGVSVRQLATFLHKHHPDKFMLWNLSEKSYDYTLLDNQVIELRFPGYPAAPLSQVFSLCNSLQAWLQADDANVAVVHCQTGRGRTVCALTWYLAWSGQLPTVQQALMHVTGKMGLPVSIIIPTQQRYLDYLSAMIAGKKPNAAPVRLERVIMNGIPKLGDRHSGPGSEEACRPYLQIFKDARLIYTSTGRDSTDLRWYTAADACVLFPVGVELEGDILVRIRHLSSEGKRVSMLRFGFHTGFISPSASGAGEASEGNNTRFVKAQLDGAYNDPRFPRDFFLDLVFAAGAPPDPATAEGAKAIQVQRAQEEYWDQTFQTRRQMKLATKADLSAPVRRSATTTHAATSSDGSGAAASAAAASASASAASSPSAASSFSSSSAVPAPSTPPKSKPSFGSLFSSATSKLTSSLFGGASDSAAATDEGALSLDLSNPEVRKLHEADQAAMRKAKRRAATEAAVAAALALSPSSRSTQSRMAPGSGQKSAAAGSDPDSFADLQAYVQGLGSLNARQLEVDSDEDETRQHGGGGGAADSGSDGHHSARARERERQDELELDRAMQQQLDDDDDDDEPAHRSFEHAPPSPPPAAAATAAAAGMSEEDMFAELGIPTSPLKSHDAAAEGAAIDAAAPSSAEAALHDASAADDPLSSDAALEAELALLSAGDLEGDGEHVGLDDADEAALLASLQEEVDGQ